MTRCHPFGLIILAVTLFSMTLAGLAGCGQEPNRKPVVKIGEVLPPDHPTSDAMAYFRQRLETHTGQGVEVRRYPSGQLGNAGELIQACRTGDIEIAVVSAAPLAQYVTDMNVVALPFIFRDSQHQARVLDGEVGQTLRRSSEQAGVVALAFMDAGTRNIMTKRGPIVRPEDLKGLKIRVMDSNVLRQTIARLGATALPMSQSEVYSALQSGVIDGWENNPPTCLKFSMHETGCVYFAWTQHVAIPDVMIVSKTWYEGLSPQRREALDRAAQETSSHQRTLWAEYEVQAVEQLKQLGMRFNEVDAQAFRDRLDGAYDEYIEKYGEGFASLIEQIQNTGSPQVDP
ncbi:TRAP transporter substrate-binding protein [Mucisphaera calidilacus]|uniref:2,3-diketo-L-gulonate-binding periplasmic protein YiaO n=1 Tax=Mucisphaera calidilacus TaxID=2527982 RepID=A0A518BWU4_9BACT|nr:TRAP transporter substrate-binding protein [Mucisphaera calidilacus]QDU71449.1 2,3-diketo-L-gulonate-binding periplasmic protein YiaO precursor [Mucisphaera calidilacus]